MDTQEEAEITRVWGPLQAKLIASGEQILSSAVSFAQLLHQYKGRAPAL